jgi:hypothetical protein
MQWNQLVRTHGLKLFACMRVLRPSTSAKLSNSQEIQGHANHRSLHMSTADGALKYT